MIGQRPIFNYTQSDSIGLTLYLCFSKTYSINVVVLAVGALSLDSSFPSMAPRAEQKIRKLGVKYRVRSVVE